MKAERAGYLAHELGDSMLVLPTSRARRPRGRAPDGGTTSAPFEYAAVRAGRFPASDFIRTS